MRQLFNKKGFTLIEMIIVISIISLLSTVGTSSYNNVLRNARDTKRKADLHEFAKAVKLYQIHHGSAPMEVGWCQSSIGIDPAHGCPPDTVTNGWPSHTTITQLVGGGYLEELPVDPINNTTYYYEYEPHNRPAGDPRPASPPVWGGYVQGRLESTNTIYRVTWEP